MIEKIDRNRVKVTQGEQMAMETIDKLNEVIDHLNKEEEVKG